MMEKIGDMASAKDRTEMLDCTECGRSFGRFFMVVRGEKIGPTACPGCEPEEWITREAKPGPDDTLAAMRRIGVNTRAHGHITFEEIDNAEVAMETKDFMRRCLEDRPHQKQLGLFLLGETGVGKTQVAAAMVRELLLKGVPEHEIKLDRARAFVGQIRDRYGTGTVDDYLDLRRNVRIWILDDAGRESPGADAFRVIDDVFDSRESHLTMLTCNKTPDELAAQWAGEDYAGAFHSRIGPSNFVFKRMDGPDRRG